MSPTAAGGKEKMSRRLEDELIEELENRNMFAQTSFEDIQEYSNFTQHVITEPPMTTFFDEADEDEAPVFAGARCCREREYNRPLVGSERRNKARSPNREERKKEDGRTYWDSNPGRWIQSPEC